MPLNTHKMEAELQGSQGRDKNQDNQVGADIVYALPKTRGSHADDTCYRESGVVCRPKENPGTDWLVYEEGRFGRFGSAQFRVEVEVGTTKRIRT